MCSVMVQNALGLGSVKIMLIFRVETARVLPAETLNTFITHAIGKVRYVYLCLHTGIFRVYTLGLFYSTW